MESIQNLLHQIQRMQWSDYLDIAVVAFLIYKILPLIKTPSTTRIAKAVVAVLIIAWLTDFLASVHGGLYHEPVSGHRTAGAGDSVPAGAAADAGSFGAAAEADEYLRRQQARTAGDGRGHHPRPCRACEAMGRKRWARSSSSPGSSGWRNTSKPAPQIDGQVSEQLIRNIFFNNSPLHDGAMIIRDGRVAAAGCVLPLSGQQPSQLGLGHPASRRAWAPARLPTR